MRSRNSLIYFTLSFAAINTLIFYLLGLRYFATWGWWPSELIGQIYLLVTYLGHIALLTFITCCLLLLPAVLLYPKRAVIFPLAVCLAVLLFIFFVLDINAYVAYRYHFTGQTLGLLLNDYPIAILGLSPQEEIIFYAFIAGAFVLESFIVWLTWNLCVRKVRIHHKVTVITTIVAVLTLLISQTIYAIANATYYRPLLQLSRAMPFYEGLDVNSLLKRWNITVAERPLQLPFTSPIVTLVYPLHPLVTSAVAKPKNILVIMIDTWRFDMVNNDVAPNIARFAKQSLQFQRHYSGGNATQPGVFSFFYGIPASYWDAMAVHHQDPMLLNELQKRNYRLGIYVSAPLVSPAFNKTVFNHIPGLPPSAQGKEGWQRDQSITRDTINFLQTAKQSKQPFFAFAFYDSVHAYSLPPHYAGKFMPYMDPLNRVVLDNNYTQQDYVNRYKNAVVYVDDLVGRVLNTLRQENLLENTIVIITADHGEEFNENKQNLWGHSSAFDDYQVHVPFIVYWPGKRPRIYVHPTSHYDVAPTLLTDVLGVKNPYADYSIGKSFFNPHSLYPFHLALSYHYIGVIEATRITEFSPGADYRVTDKQLNPVPGDPYDADVMKQAYELLHRY